MLNPEGNTGVYNLYAYVRILSILEKSTMGTGAGLAETKQKAAFKVSNAQERELALSLLRLPEQLDLTIEDLKINMLTDQLYETSVKFS